MLRYYLDHFCFEEDFEVFGRDIGFGENFGLELLEGLGSVVLDRVLFFFDFEGEFGHMDV